MSAPEGPGGPEGPGNTVLRGTAFEDLLHRWLPRQRWYPAKGRGVGLRHLGVTVLTPSTPGGGGAAPEGVAVPGDTAGGDPGDTVQAQVQVQVQVHVIGLDSGDRVDVVQVPLTVRDRPVPALAHALVGTLDTTGAAAGGTDGGRGGSGTATGAGPLTGTGTWTRTGSGTVHVYDGPHDPDYVSALLAGLRVPDGVPGPPVDGPSRVLTGEQSNTSVLVDPQGADPLIVKVFRTLQPGENPDVAVTGALSAAGCTAVPRLRGWSRGTWSSPGATTPPDPTGTGLCGDLAVATEYLPGSTDGWAAAVASARAGTSFATEAHALGGTLAQVHRALAEAFGREPAGDGRARTVAALQERVAWAVRSVPALSPWAGALDRWSRSLTALPPVPAAQRVHGDLHLGQTLRSPTRGWVLLDFEGEPLRPLSQRTAPDLALRDVAGMLRSFDYAAATAAGARQDAAGEPGASWVRECREVFRAGYRAAGGEEPAGTDRLLPALELDKALYEVVYEARNRPDWLPVPLRAVARLLPGDVPDRSDGTGPGRVP